MVLRSLTPEPGCAAPSQPLALVVTLELEGLGARDVGVDLTDRRIDLG
jgi:hypothetical protein